MRNRSNANRQTGFTIFIRAFYVKQDKASAVDLESGYSGSEGGRSREVRKSEAYVLGAPHTGSVGISLYHAFVQIVCGVARTLCWSEFNSRCELWRAP